MMMMNLFIRVNIPYHLQVVRGIACHCNKYIKIKQKTRWVRLSQTIIAPVEQVSGETAAFLLELVNN